MSEVKQTQWGKLPEEFKKKWIDALRSGEFTQGHGSLVNGCDFLPKPIHCCLGVACRIVGLSDADILDYTTIDFLDNDTDDPIPQILRGEGDKGTLVHHLIEMNDSQNKSFSEIADFIEQNL